MAKPKFPKGTVLGIDTRKAFLFGRHTTQQNLQRGEQAGCEAGKRPEFPLRGVCADGKSSARWRLGHHLVASTLCYGTVETQLAARNLAEGFQINIVNRLLCWTWVMVWGRVGAVL